MCVSLIKAGRREGSPSLDKMPDSWSNNHHSKNALTLPEYNGIGNVSQINHLGIILCIASSVSTVTKLWIASAQCPEKACFQISVPPNERSSKLCQIMKMKRAL